MDEKETIENAPYPSFMCVFLPIQYVLMIVEIFYDTNQDDSI